VQAVSLLVRHALAEARQIAVNEINTEFRDFLEPQINEFLLRTENLLEVLRIEGIETTHALNDRIGIRIDRIRGQLKELSSTAEHNVEWVVALVRENPWTAMGVSAAAGLALGSVISAGTALALARDRPPTIWHRLEKSWSSIAGRLCR